MDLKKIIQNYTPFNEQEEKDKESFLQFLNNFNEEDWSVRENLIGHLTASVWLTNKDRSKIVMAYHKLYDCWAWLGGHADGDLNLLNVAIKEAKEESGLSSVKVLKNAPIDLSVMSVFSHIKHGKFVPDHLHFNVTYLLEANESDELFHKPDENSAVKWMTNKEVLETPEKNTVRDIYKRIVEKVERK